MNEKMAGVEHSLLRTLLQDGIAREQTFYLTVSSNSMSPLLRPGDEIAVEGVSATQLQPGDLVVLDEQSGFLTHRYWGESSHGQLVTRGDRNLQFDPPWSREQLCGRVIARRGRTALSFRHGPGARLGTHLTRVAAVEQRLFSGATRDPRLRSTAPGAAYLGRKLGKDRRYLPGRLVRRAFWAWSYFITFIYTMIAVVGGSEAGDNAE